MYRCDCETCGGEIQCYGKTDIDISTDCTLLMNVPGTCAQNGYPSGPQDDDGQGPDCFAVIGDKCYMRDKKTGNTFTCPCDGNCNVGVDNVRKGVCQNPYDDGSDDEPQDTTWNPNSSPSGQSSSSPAVSSSSPVTDTTQVCDNCSKLEAIQANTQAIMNNTNNLDNGLNNINNSIGETNDNLEQIKTSVDGYGQSIVSAVNGVKSSVQTNTSAVNSVGDKVDGVNSTLQGIGETINEWMGLWSNQSSPSVPGSSSSNSSSSEEFDNSGFNDSLSAIGAWWSSYNSSVDSLYNYIDSLRNDTTSGYIVFDSIYNWADTSTIKSKLSDFFFPGNTINSCFEFEAKADFPLVGELDYSIDFSNLFGKFDFCSLIRIVIRILTTIAVVFSTIHAFKTAFSNGG
ncbi:MAG: hypothetical protein MJY99_08810 [Fibrobacter sp.]|nr:hypothetical protein [Fibrobacter sp.]